MFCTVGALRSARSSWYLSLYLYVLCPLESVSEMFTTSIQDVVNDDAVEAGERLEKNSGTSSETFSTKVATDDTLSRLPRNKHGISLGWPSSQVSFDLMDR